MREKKRERRRLELRRERLRVLDARALEQVVAGHCLAPRCSRFCITGDAER
jgi:hypothetical protein